MPTGTTLPPPGLLRELLSGLIGRDVEVRPFADPPAVGGGSGSVVGLYVDDALRSAAVIVLDLALGARLGAAIGLLAPAAAAEAEASGRLPTGLRENVAEILNVLAAALNTPRAPHLRLYTVMAEGNLRCDVQAFAVRTAPRADLTVDVPRYGSGTMAIAIA